MRAAVGIAANSSTGKPRNVAATKSPKVEGVSFPSHAIRLDAPLFSTSFGISTAVG